MATDTLTQTSDFQRGVAYDFERPLNCRCADGSAAEFSSGVFRSGIREGGGTLIFEGEPVGGGTVIGFAVPVGTRATKRT